MARILRLLAVFAVALAACGSGGAALPDDALGIVVSSDLAVGTQRVAVAVIASDNTSLVTPDLDAELEFLRPDGTSAGTEDAEFVWAIENVRGMLVADHDFDTSGVWQMTIRTDGGQEVAAGPFQVFDEPFTVGVGEPAPASDSKTAAEGELHVVSSDPEPDPRFYTMTVGEAVTSGSPSVVIFATPAFCVSATCGPVLDVAKLVADDHPGVGWVHVEVFDNHLTAASREELVVVPAVDEWRLRTEPWVFVVDGAGIVTARFEGALGEAELRTALDALG